MFVFPFEIWPLPWSCLAGALRLGAFVLQPSLHSGQGIDVEIFHSVVALLFFEAFVTEHVREIRKNSETVHMQIPSITYV